LLWDGTIQINPKTIATNCQTGAQDCSSLVSSCKGNTFVCPRFEAEGSENRIGATASNYSI